MGEAVDIDTGRRDGLPTAEREGSPSSAGTTGRLREDVEILKRARAFFAVPGGLDRFFAAFVAGP